MTDHSAANSSLRVTTYLCAGDAAAALDFYIAAFGAIEVLRWIDPDNGKVGHAEIQIGATRLYVADGYPQMSAHRLRTPADLGGTTMQLWLEVGDLDATLTRALAAGATQLTPIERGQDGEQRCRLTDPAGHLWTLTAPALAA